jgi:hypothetical protein
MPRVNRNSRPIPIISSSRSTPLELNDYSKGMNSYVSDDVFKNEYLRLAQDARITTLGEYETRKGFDFHSDAAGETLDQSITSTTGADTKAVSETVRLAQKFTAGASQRLSKVELNLSNANAATGTVLVELWTDSSGTPGELIARTSIASSDIGSSAAYEVARFPDAPSITATTVYWIVCYVQTTGSGSYGWTSTTSATTALVSSDSGVTWDTTSFALNFKQYYATSGGVKGLHRAYKSDGTSVTLFAHGTTLYSVDNSTGALTSVKTGLDASATKYRFVTVNDVVYYVNGYDGLRKYNFSTESQITSTDYTDILIHKGLLFLQDAGDPNKWVFSNFADYETFTSTDFFYIPSPKTGDPVVAGRSLNGYLLFWTRNNKYILSGEDNATFRLDEALDQKGSYTSETVTQDLNYAYFLSDDGVYQTNGMDSKLISKNVYEEVRNITDKDGCVIQVNKNRLYLWYAASGSSVNNKCFVWNLNFETGMTESQDTNAYVGRALNAFNDEDRLLVASPYIGQVYWQELDSNDYTNLGGDINYLLATHYNSYSIPSVEKQIRYWKPRFGSQSGNYNISCEYAYDQRDNWQVVTSGTVDVQGSGYLWGDADTVWGAFTWGTTNETQASLYIPGEWRRIATRYKHYATRQPQRFLGHTFIYQTRRIR